jgi:2-keto-4-pentenoate hydratase
MLCTSRDLNLPPQKQWTISLVQEPGWQNLLAIMEFQEQKKGSLSVFAVESI